MKMYLIILPVFFLCGEVTFPQIKAPPPNHGLKSIPLQTPATILDGDTVALFELPPVTVASLRVFANNEEALKYYRLRYDVKVAYPYAVLAETTFKECEAKLATMDKGSEKRRYLKEVEKQMCDEYKKDLKSMSEEQGRILIKLINRETGSTSYEMVKDLKGSLTAFMWQTVAGLFGNNMKDTYDPEGKDKDIEGIIRLIEMGDI
jgi:hypothetical protein